MPRMLHRRHRRQADEHLLRRLVRERDGEDRQRRRLARREQPRDARRQHARLAAARAGEDQRRSMRQRDGGELLGIEVGEKGKSSWRRERSIIRGRGAIIRAPGDASPISRRRFRCRRIPHAAPPAHSATTRAFVQWIRSAAPYIHAFRGKTFVIAFGGEVVADDTFLGIIHDLNLLHSLGVHLVVVHGSRPQIEAILAQQDIESRYAFGLRITDAETMDCVLEADGQVRSRIEALLSLGIANSPMAGARIRVSTGNFITAKPLGVRDGIDMQLTGEVRRVDIDAIHQRLDDGDIVLISPLGYSPTGEIFNLALEEVATQVAVRICGAQARLPDGDRGRAQRPPQLLTELSTKDAEALARAQSRQAARRRPALPALRDPRLRQRRQARAPHQPARRRRAAARALHARRRRHDDRVGAARPPAQRHDRRRRRHPADHRAARGAGHPRAPLARAAGDGDRALRRRRARQRDHRLRRRCTPFPTRRSASSRRSPCIPISGARATAKR